MSILTTSGRAAIAASIKQQPIHLAWGNGNTSWQENPPPEQMSATGLIKEVGRRTANEVSFCIPDEQGDLIIPTGRFRAVDEATNNLYINFTFDFTDSPDEIIRELGVMVGTTVNGDLPPGQRYFLPNEITKHGILLVLEHTVPLVRTPATRETFSFVVTF